MCVVQCTCVRVEPAGAGEGGRGGEGRGMMWGTVARWAENSAK